MNAHFTRGKCRDEQAVIVSALDAIENAYNTLCALPQRDTLRFFRLQDHQEAAETNLQPAAGMFVSVLRCVQLAQVFWYSTAFKPRQSQNR
jgi:hypothetical protein